MKKLFYFAILTSLLLPACADKLDQEPDNRTYIDTPAKVGQLLTSAYPSQSPAVLCELSADTYEDNNVVLMATHRAPYALWNDECFAWEDIRNYSSGDADTPYDVWETYYAGIAVCNHALQAIEEIRKDYPESHEKLERSRGEALVLRAYLHFTLVNVFAQAYKNDEDSKADIGIPYVTEPETTVRVNYNRPSVAENYASIQKDLEEGLPLIDDAAYSVRAYHFNRNAALAFAARFFLYKRDWAKAERYASDALGSNPASMLRKWSTLTATTTEGKNQWYDDESAACNFMLQTTYSLHYRMLGACRYASNGTAQRVHTYGPGPCWSQMLPCYSGNLYIFGDGQEYGVWMFRLREYFEYTDKIAGIGYVHTLYKPFTAEETLLCRAEARLYLGDKAGCINDLNQWAVSKLCSTTLTEQRMRSFYTANSKGFVCEINPDLMGWGGADVQTAQTEKHVVDCILHFRRIETLYEGLRWFDVKRYGIPLTHNIQGPLEVQPRTVHLPALDARRALQIPNDVIEAGLVPNDRTTSATRTKKSSEFTGTISVAQ